MTSIQASHYAEKVAELRRDPTIQGMAVGLSGIPRDSITHPDGGPRHEFMGVANDEYHNVRGGKIYGHLGAVAQALISLLDKPPTPEERFYGVPIDMLYQLWDAAPEHSEKLIGDLAAEIDRREGITP